MQPIVRKVDKQLLQSGVALLRFAEVAAVEADVAEDAAAVLAAQLFAVFVFKVRQANINELADIGFVAVLEKVVERTLLGNLEPFAAHGPLCTLRIAVVALEVLLVFRLADIADVLQEQRREDVVLVLTGVNHAPEGVAGLPYDFVNLFLCNFTVHLYIFLSIYNRLFAGGAPRWPCRGPVRGDAGG